MHWFWDKHLHNFTNKVHRQVRYEIRAVVNWANLFFAKHNYITIVCLLYFFLNILIVNWTNIYTLVLVYKTEVTLYNTRFKINIKKINVIKLEKKPLKRNRYLTFTQTTIFFDIIILLNFLCLILAEQF